MNEILLEIIDFIWSRKTTEVSIRKRMDGDDSTVVLRIE